MTDDSPSPDQPAAGSSDNPPPFEPDRTVMRPRDPQPPADAFDDGDGDDGDSAGNSAGDPGETQPLRADGPPPPPPTMTPADAPSTEFAPASPVTTAIPTGNDGIPLGGFAGEPPAQPGGPIEPEFPMRASRAGFTGAVVAIGTGLLAAAVVIAAVRARSDGDLDWSNYGIALAATGGLLAIALLGALSSRKAGGRAREDVVTWPGVVGILGVAICIGIGIDDDGNWVGYLIGSVVVVLAAIGYVAARRAAFVVVAIAGLALIYGLAFDDFVADSIGDGHPEVTGAVLVSVFVVVVTLLGWALPSRAVTGVVVGVFGLVGFVGIMISFVVFRYLGAFFGGMPMFMGDSSFGGADADDAMNGAVHVSFDESDVWWVLAFAAVLTVLWALAAAVSNHSGFTILAIAAPAILVPLATAALAAEHPSVWAGVLAGAGGVVLLGGVVLARLRGRRTANELSPDPSV
ncbi:hypothetical protein CFH99_23445 [Nocardioides aromaticivorans]|uniref:Uncharacterized protein n=1 Tax=Nocardioides aromaticivorans TaxID=200618 RepID=A0ABX7PSI7_9ACTN|nr:hypothetical protein [Nocardioides aromaticivorans]QSR28583.1 hypothetical protein CFH99_23445 [Nocardioides aromaticivorans]